LRNNLTICNYYSGSLPSQVTDIDDVELPLSVTDRVYIVELVLKTYDKYDCGSDKAGQWMLQLDTKDLNRVWMKATELYRKGELTGIQSMFINTSYSNNLHQGKKAIFFKCSPCDERDVVESYGRNLLKYFGNFCNSHAIYYKGTHEASHKKCRFPYVLRLDDLENEANASDQPAIDLTNDEEDSVVDMLKKMSFSR